MAVGALIGVTPANAASATHLCTITDQTLCADVAGSEVAVEMHVPSVVHVTWTYPNVAGAYGAIKEAGVNLCMQVDHADGDVVRAAPCVGDAAEIWINEYDSYTHRTLFISQWALGAYNDQNYCLTGSDTYVANEVVLQPCSDSYSAQSWGTS